MYGKVVGSAIFSDDLTISLSHRLPDECNVFQMEIHTIYRVCWLLDDRSISGHIGIIIDSLAPLLSLKSQSSTFLLIRQYKKKLNGLMS